MQRLYLQLHASAVRLVALGIPVSSTSYPKLLWPKSSRNAARQEFYAPSRTQHRRGEPGSDANRLLRDPQSVPYQPTAWRLPLGQWKQTLRSLTAADMQTSTRRRHQGVQLRRVHEPYPCLSGKYRALLHRQQYDGDGPRNSVAYRELGAHHEPATDPSGCRRAPSALP